MDELIVIADDHPLFAGALKQILNDHFPECSLPVAPSICEVGNLLRTHGAADLLLLDLKMPGANGYSGLTSIILEFPETPIVVVSATEDADTIQRCFRLGASGFIPKSSSPEFIAKCVQDVLDGEPRFPSIGEHVSEFGSESSELDYKLRSLTPQETRVLSMLGEGLLNRQIAERLGISEATTKAHVSKILLKLDVINRTHAVIMTANKASPNFDKTSSSAANNTPA